MYKKVVFLVESSMIRLSGQIASAAICGNFGIPKCFFDCIAEGFYLDKTNRFWINKVGKAGQTYHKLYAVGH